MLPDVPAPYQRTHLCVLSDPDRIFAFGEVLSKKEAREMGWEEGWEEEEEEEEEESMVPLDEEAMKAMEHDFCVLQLAQGAWAPMPTYHPTEEEEEMMEEQGVDPDEEDWGDRPAFGAAPGASVVVL